MKDALQAIPRKGSRLSSIGVWTALIGVVLAALSGLGAQAGFLSPFASMGAYTGGSLLLRVRRIVGVAEQQPGRVDGQAVVWCLAP